MSDGLVHAYNIQIFCEKVKRKMKIFFVNYTFYLLFCKYFISYYEIEYGMTFHKTSRYIPRFLESHEMFCGVYRNFLYHICEKHSLKYIL